MADEMTVSNNEMSYCKDSICIDVGKVFDSCCDRDCLDDLRLYFSKCSQEVINCATSVHCKDAEVAKVLIDVKPVTFNKGYFTVDLTFFFVVKLEVCTKHHVKPVEVCGVTCFEKKCILYGGEGNVKVFSSKDECKKHCPCNSPKALVEVLDPVCLGARLCDYTDSYETCKCFPKEVCEYIGGEVWENECDKTVLVSLGLFSIIKLIRNVQVKVPIIDYCVPEKRCHCTEPCVDPCDIFKKIKFPTDEFFPKSECKSPCDEDKD